jgi:hypothetical protein
MHEIKWELKNTTCCILHVCTYLLQYVLEKMIVTQQASIIIVNHTTTIYEPSQATLPRVMLTLTNDNNS